MTGWTKRGKGVYQREKIYAMIRCENGLSVYEITGLCWKSKDPIINSIKPPTIRRCLQELRDHRPTMARKNELTERWIGYEITIQA